MGTARTCRRHRRGGEFATAVWKGRWGWVDFFGFKPGGPAVKIAGTVFAATLLFLIIGLAEIAFQTGFGLVGETTYFSRWAKLATGGWAFVVVGGLLFDPIAAKIAHVLVGEKTSQIEEVLEAE